MFLESWALFNSLASPVDAISTVRCHDWCRQRLSICICITARNSYTPARPIHTSYPFSTMRRMCCIHCVEALLPSIQPEIPLSAKQQTVHTTACGSTGCLLHNVTSQPIVLWHSNHKCLSDRRYMLSQSQSNALNLPRTLPLLPQSITLPSCIAAMSATQGLTP
jgi:hypothetical protein